MATLKPLVKTALEEPHVLSDRSVASSAERYTTHMKLTMKLENQPSGGAFSALL
jgi:hypothetical protein